MLLKDKNAVIYGAAGAIGGAVARAFAGEGARVFLAGRTQATLDALAGEINRGGGRAEAATVDALDRDSVERHLDGVMERAGRLDVSFNAVDSRSVQGTPLVDMSPGDFAQPIEIYTRTNFLTGTAAARRMAGNRAGVIMMITARPDRLGIQNSGGFGVACAAIEAFTRALASEVSPNGIRVVCIRSAGSPDAPGVREAIAIHAAKAGMSPEEFTAKLGSRALLRRMPLLAEVANAAALMASDHATAMTAAVANVTCGEIAD